MSEILNEAVLIMVTGMVTVFVFLIMLIGAMAVLRKIAIEDESQLSSPATSATGNSKQPTQAIISAAVTRYRQQHKR